MTRRRSLLAWMLLAVFAVGGTVGPVAHRIQHGTQRLAAAVKEPCHPPAAHRSDVPLWTGEANDLSPLDCDLCATRLLVVLPALAPASSPRIVGTVRVGAYSHLVPVYVVPNRTIRGPPRPFGFRLV